MKRSPSPEANILPEISWADMQPRLIERLRNQAVLQDPHHAWKGLSDQELIANAELSRSDPITGETGYTLAALLLLGTPEALRTNLPFQGTQAVYRPGKWQRGEREELRTNLLETHDALMAFGARHLPDLEVLTSKGESLQLRDLILSEIFANSLVYRDYGKVFPARFVIEADRVFMENGMASGKKPGQKFSPNPLIANVFKQIGWGQKPGAKSSVVAQFGRSYFGILPLVVEGSVYRILAPFPKKGAPPALVSHSWDISEMLTTQAPWTQSKAAQNEVDQTRNALNDLVEDPMLSEVENMQIPAPIDLPEPHLYVNVSNAKPANGHVNGHAKENANGHVTPSVAEPVLHQGPQSSSTQAPRPVPHQAPQHVMHPETQPVRVSELVAKPVEEIKNGYEKSATKNQAVIQAERTEKILSFCRTPRYRSEMQAHVGIVNRDYFRKDILNPLIEKGLLHPTLPDKPNSPKQQYTTLAP